MPMLGTKMRYVPQDMKDGTQNENNQPKPITRDQWKKIAHCLEIGADLQTAASYARISFNRLQRNLNADKGLAKDVLELFAQCKVHHLQKIYDGEKGWQASAWFLSRIYRKEFGEVPGNTEEEKAIQMRKIVRRKGPIPESRLQKPVAN